MNFCPTCGAARQPGLKFCPSCGTPYESGQAGASGPSVELRLEALLPWRTWLRQDFWRRGLSGLFLLMAIVPFVLLRATDSVTTIRPVAAGFAIYFAATWLVVLYLLLRPHHVPIGRYVCVAAFTAVAGVAIALGIEKHVAPNGNDWLGFIFGVGIPEEAAKALAVCLFLVPLRPRLTTRQFMFAGAVSGLAFGAAEAISYSNLYAAAAPFVNASTYTSVVVWRLLTDSLFHGVMTGVAAYFIGLAVQRKAGAWVLAAGGIGLMGVLHGTYDRLSGGWPGTLMAAAILFVFVGYARTGDDVRDDFLTPRERLIPPRPAPALHVESAAPSPPASPLVPATAVPGTDPEAAMPFPAAPVLSTPPTMAWSPALPFTCEPTVPTVAAPTVTSTRGSPAQPQYFMPVRSGEPEGTAGQGGSRAS